jgi:prepilin-type N-terminal cleavage/methylation domain-containing protein
MSSDLDAIAIGGTCLAQASGMTSFRGERGFSMVETLVAVAVVGIVAVVALPVTGGRSAACA